MTGAGGEHGDDVKDEQTVVRAGGVLPAKNVAHAVFYAPKSAPGAG